jgi:hypothetical protein
MSDNGKVINFLPCTILTSRTYLASGSSVDFHFLELSLAAQMILPFNTCRNYFFTFVTFYPANVPIFGILVDCGYAPSDFLSYLGHSGNSTQGTATTKAQERTLLARCWTSLKKSEKVGLSSDHAC